MPATQASTETRVPRQVAARVAASVARYTPTETDPPNPAAPNAPAPGPAAAAATPTDPQAPAVDPRHSDPNYWKQRFDVTSGILARERGERNTQIADLNRRITELQDQARNLQAAAPAAEIDLTKYFTPAQIETYGEEQCRVMAQTADKAATTKAQELIDAAVRPLREERTQAAANDAERAKQAFVDKLTELVPDWQTIDKDPRWLEGWLPEEDENGVQRQQLLDIHIANRNAAAAAKMFKRFAKSIEVPAPPVAPSGTGANPGGDAEPPTPGAVASATPPTKAEVKDFYKRSATIRRGQPGYVTDQERATFEARLKLAHPDRA
jgi:hypothetical protein